MTSAPVLISAGAAIGLLYGLFGVGSAFATPLLSFLGVPALAAVASPLPALSPGSAAGGWTYARLGLVDRQLARRTLVGALPACIVGAVASRWIGGPWLLVLSGVVLMAVGLRILVPGSVASARVDRRDRAALIVGLGVGVGFVAGLLSNGGGFVLVPMFLLALGLTLPEATATSLVVVTVLTVPTVVTHALLGDINWGDRPALRRRSRARLGDRRPLRSSPARRSAAIGLRRAAGRRRGLVPGPPATTGRPDLNRAGWGSRWLRRRRRPGGRGRRTGCARSVRWAGSRSGTAAP